MQMRAVTYRRVSTREQGDSGLGLEAQERALKATIEAKGWAHVADFHDVHTGKTTNGRKSLRDALVMLERGEADILLVSKLDRLSRSVKDFATLLERAREHGWKLKMLDPDIDTSTASGEMCAGILAQVGQWSGRLISENTKDALAAAKARGTRLGRPATLPDAVAERIAAHRATGASLQAIADSLNADKVPTAHGGARWYPKVVSDTVRRAADYLEAAIEKAPKDVIAALNDAKEANALLAKCRSKLDPAMETRLTMALQHQGQAFREVLYAKSDAARAKGLRGLRATTERALKELDGVTV